MKNTITKIKYAFAVILLVGAMGLMQSCVDDDINKLPETCFDGAMNGIETGVDCGGDCQPCATCDDGIQNGNETGVDCGGPDCDACPETCDDGIKNNGETEVDCGGPNCEPCAVAVDQAIVSYHNYMALGNPMFHTFESEDTSVGVIDGDPGNNVNVDQGAALPMMTFGVADPVDATRMVGRYNRPEGLISDGFSDYKFAISETGKYNFDNLNQFEVSVFTPSEVITGDVTAQVELIFLDRDNPAFWETWTILSGVLTKTGEWETIMFDGSSLVGKTDYDQIAIRIGGSNHQTGATFFVKDFAVVSQDVFMQALFNNDMGYNLDLTSDPGNNVDVDQGAALPMMSFGVAGPKEGIVSRYNRPEGLISDGFSDYKFGVNDAKYNFESGTNFVIEVFTPEGTIHGDVTPTVELIFLDKSNSAFWETWTILTGVLTKTGEWETIQFDGTPVVGTSIYDQIGIRLGGSNHQDAATFYVRSFNGFVSK
ncbi:hypothetical protein [Tamlana sp. I1]|uniref:hypothetical protein n=1 Tax=Tamlana sp. I1 TaxID=2762061 RepID=UPI00189022F1|nr:hypothetical protein [Tamlana sp. I1]